VFDEASGEQRIDIAVDGPATLPTAWDRARTPVVSFA
jgi:hypothetical protein